MDLLLISIALPLVWMALVAVLNVFTLPRLKFQASPVSWPFTVSVLIPARNEAQVIGATVRALLAQPEVSEVLVLDDHSTDHTAQVARLAAQGDERLRVLTGQTLPSGWLGKNWACHQLAQVARGEVLIFTDADVQWHAGSVRAVLREFNRTQADLLTVLPAQITQTWSERLVVPLISFAILAYLPLLAIHHVPWQSLSAAIGQCLVFRRTAYQKIDGHERLRACVIEDLKLASNIKRAQLRLRLAASELVVCHMYHSWAEVRAGFAKNILAGHGSLAGLIFSTIFHWLLFVVVWFLPFGWLLGGLGLLVRLLLAQTLHQKLTDVLFMPISVFLMTLIALQALVWQVSGGARWKDRRVPQS